MRVRPAVPADADELVRMRRALWPDGPAAEHRRDVAALLAGRPRSSLPLALLVAEDAAGLGGFIEVGLRSHADGCDPTCPVGYVEGWFVQADRRGQGVGRALMEAAEAWSAAQGCRELASDTWADNADSQRAHRALGFELVDRCVNYRKPIAAGAATGAHYGHALARVHHEHHGELARAAAEELLRRLGERGIAEGRVVDLAAGSGILARAASEAGFEVWGVDISPAMLELARGQAPRARFTRASLWEAELPPCVAVCAVGEALAYASDPRALEAEALVARLGSIHAALQPGGLLLFDLVGPQRSGPSGRRRVLNTRADCVLAMEEERRGSRLERRIELFQGGGTLYRRSSEVHRLRVDEPAQVEALLKRLGFRAERLDGYAGYSLLPGWHAFAAGKPSA